MKNQFKQLFVHFEFIPTKCIGKVGRKWKMDPVHHLNANKLNLVTILAPHKLYRLSMDLKRCLIKWKNEGNEAATSESADK